MTRNVDKLTSRPRHAEAAITPKAGIDKTNSDSALELPIILSVAGAATSSSTVATGLNLCSSWFEPAHMLSMSSLHGAHVYRGAVHDGLLMRSWRNAAELASGQPLMSYGGDSSSVRVV